MKKNLNLYVSKAYNVSASLTPNKFFLALSLMSLLFLLISSMASAQSRVITGTVNDDAQQALAGVSVAVKETTQGVLTDENGRFSISVDVSKHDVLVFSFIGKKTTEQSIAENGNAITLTLYNDPRYFTELVVTGGATADQLYTEKKSKRNRTKRLH